MATQFDIDCALMAGVAYRSTREERNRFPIPEGWTEVALSHVTMPSGFEAVSFQRGDEIVISYAGTYDKSFGDLATDLALGVFGVSSTQLYEAAEYYLQVKADNSSAKITLTGHSLGGGLASLVAVFFNETATTFDQAPFRNSASGITATALRTYLKLNFPASIYPQISDWLAPLDRFIVSFDPLGLGWSQDGLDAREAKVTNLSVQGEFLSVAPAFRIGTELPPLTHGAYFGPFDLHAQSLLTAFVENDQFREVTTKLTDLLGMIFDKNLYFRDPNKLTNPEVNLLEHLIRHQEGLDPAVPNDGDHMLDRFTSDLWKIAQEGGLTMANSDLTKALTAFAMQAYYFNRPESNATLFDAETGGIHFDRMDVADTLDGDTGAKGYTMYFTNYLATLPATDRDLIVAQLPNLLDWYIQAGSQAMNATAGTQRAFMLGGSGDDTLTGGSQADVLVGNGGRQDTLYGMGGNDTLCGGSGADTLNGGADADLMIGGEGIDTYYIEGNDTIRDTGRNIIVYQGQVIAGAFLREGTSNTYSFLGDNNFTLTFDSAAHLTVNGTDSITFEQQTSAADFENGDFGITLYDSAAANYVLTGDDGKDYSFNSLGDGNGGYVGVAFHVFSGVISGPYVNAYMGDDAWPMFAYSTYSTPPNLQIDGAGGDDYLMGLAGSDSIEGGSGNDRIIGDGFVNDPNPLFNPWGNTGAADILQGGAGTDYISGGFGDDLLSGGEDQDFLKGGNEDDTVGGDAGNDVVAGGLGNDLLTGGSGDDFLYGDSAIKPVFPPGGYEDSLHQIDLASMSVEAGYAEAGYPVSVIFNGFNVAEEIGEGGNDLLLGGVGNDLLSGDGGNDTLLGEADHDTLIGGSGDDYLDGSDGNDWLLGDNGDMTGSGNDTLLGGVGDDLLYGLGGSDTLNGGIGNDGLFGGEGNDTLDGGAGDDWLDGGAGDDLYHFNAGNDVDIIHDVSGQNTVAFGVGIAFADISDFIRDGNDLVVGIGMDGDQITFSSWYSGTEYQIDRFTFMDGTELSGVEFLALLTGTPVLRQGTSGNDVLQGFAGVDNMTGGTGNDTLLGYVGNDVLDGGSGDDNLDGGTGADTLKGGDGNDTLKGADGNDYLSGDVGTDTLFGGLGTDRLYGGIGNDFLDGGDSYDSLYGGADNDTLLGGIGDDSL